LSDSKCRPIALAVTGGQVADVKMLQPLLDAVPAPDYLVADKAYDADKLRQALIEQGTTPVIPNKGNRLRYPLISSGCD
jgi:IS5 family transposase